jgi:Putative Actinobacterial Holin-X, holin superfamily III
MTSLNLRPIPEIFTDLIGQLTSLVRKEGQLARSEISEKLNRALAGMALILAGAVLLIPALVILLQAAMVAMMESGMSPALAALITGGAALVLGIVLALVGWSWIKPSALVPDQTIDQLQRDADVARHAASPTSSHEKPLAQETGHGYQRNRAA